MWLARLRVGNSDGVSASRFLASLSIYEGNYVQNRHNAGEEEGAELSCFGVYFFIYFF